jgi:ADP-ribose pyrophosphatase YjhB (NUDIX family)
MLPIACVDVLVTRRGASGHEELGLIFRETPHQGRRWCLIGGRLLLNEPFSTAIIRHVAESLGREVVCVPSRPVQPLFVAQYFPIQRDGDLFDPRQHAVGLTFLAKIGGTPRISGEALAFQWFNPALFGFEQDRVIQECLRRMRYLQSTSPERD